MKKCPTCGKTFENNLKFCQTDGTPLVDDAPPPDPYQTVVVRPEDIGAPIPIEPITPSTKTENVDDVLEIPEDDDEIEDNDPLKTMVSTGSPFGDDDDLMKTAVVSEAERKEIFGEKTETNSPPPSPFGSSPAEISPAPPEIPKFNEPDLSPPNFGNAGSSSPPKLEKTPPPITPPSEPPPVVFEPPKTPSVPPNTPIPSPFDASMPPGYQTPSSPPFKEPETKSNELSTPFGNSPFNNPAPEKQQMQQQSDWSPPSAPAPNVPNQQINQPPSDGGGQNQTLAIVSLGLGVLSIPCCGFIILGIGAIITGFMARSKAASNPNQYGGENLALAGIILGALTTLVGIIGNILALIGVIPIPQF